MKKILCTAPLHFISNLQNSLIEQVDIYYENNPSFDETKKILIENNFDGWVCNPCPPYNIGDDLMKHSKNLKIIATPSTGTNHINLNDALKFGIEIKSLRNSEIVNKIYSSSEFTFNLLISTVRKFYDSINYVRDGHWRDIEDQLRGRELNGLTIGIIGYGRIGGNLSKYCNAFDMKVLSYDPYKKISDSWCIQKENMKEVVSNCDILAICVHLNDETKGFINEEVFSWLKNGCYFINSSRGDTINEAALLKNLISGKIIAAGLDVISNEDKILKDFSHPLIEYAKNNSNLYITPHIAGLTFDSEYKAQVHSINSIIKFLNL